jgi:hypothetical protein
MMDRMDGSFGNPDEALLMAAGMFWAVGFAALGLVPASNLNIRAEMTSFSLNYTFWLNLIFGALARSFIVESFELER